MPFTTGTVIQNRYRIVSLLGEGGMGRVYRAYDLNLDIAVALKEMTPDPQADQQTLTELRRQFKHEAQIVATLDHPNLVRVTDYFSAGQSECLVMNFVEGESLADRVAREGPQLENLIVSWAHQLLDALAYCHARNVIHRDIKPQNVVITANTRPILVDFGLVKLWDPQDPHTRTVIRALGTPEYAPPEQYGVFAEHTDARSDLYSLGALLYHALTGEAPLSATDRMARPDQFAAPRHLNPQISPHVEEAILRAMELPINQRFRSAQEMKQALTRTALPHPATAKLTDPSQTSPIWKQRLRKLPGSLFWGLGLLLLIVGAFATRNLRSQSGDKLPATQTSTLVITQEKTDPTVTLTSKTLKDTSFPTSTPLPTREPATPEPTASPTIDNRAQAREAVEASQEARAIAYRTWNTEGYYEVLVGSALESSLEVVDQLKRGDCRYYIEDEADMTFRYEGETADRITVVASRAETQRRQCGESVEYVCQAFNGRYIVELWGDRWVITDKSVENYQQISPCP